MVAPSAGYRTDIPGFHVRRTPRFCVVELDFIADPVKRDPAWAVAERKTQSSEKEWRREYLRDWTSAAGDSYYPEFDHYGKEQYLHDAKGFIAGMPVYRGWDFGFRHPACIWFQWSPKQRRIWILREFMPANLRTADFRDCVLFLSGHLEYERLSPVAASRLETTLDYFGYPRGPWFPAGTPIEWRDFGGYEATQVRAASSEDTTVIDAQVLAEGGIILGFESERHQARAELIHSLLRPTPDGWPGLWIDPSCTLMIAGFSGGFAYKKPTPMDPIPDKVAKDGYYEHVHEAFGYGVLGVVPLVQDAPAPPPRARYEGRLRREEPGDLNLLSFYELDGKGRNG